MPKNTLTRSDLSKAVSRESGLSHTDSEYLVKSVLGYISDALVNGEQVKIPKFGTFSVRSKSARPGRNPRTSELVIIAPRRVITFNPSKPMRDCVETGNKI